MRTVARLPNTRVQRTRCRSPLTRKSLGDLVVAEEGHGAVLESEASGRGSLARVEAFRTRPDSVARPARDHHRGVGAASEKLRSPNTRVQRTRCRSPLTRKSLGSSKSRGDN